ncbi:MAG: acylphosphatase [Thermodesulfobacteriota bacterium]|nr:MAG: acylphosphatase [Thermodesulfobacteriota bacterium]
MGKVRAHILIEGLVQGVYFRANTVEVAKARKCSGWVRNTYEGGVEAVIEGEEADVRSLIDWCRKGPTIARVDHVAVDWEAYTGEFDGFTAAP